MALRKSYQSGTVALIRRKKLPSVWVLRYTDGDGIRKAQQIGTVEKYPTKADVNKAVSAILPEINAQVEGVYWWQLVDRFEKEELPERKSTQPSVRSNLKRLRAAFERDRLDDLVKNPAKIELWLKDAKTLKEPFRPLAKKTKYHLHGLMHQMFDRAVVYQFLNLVRNPMDTVKVKGKVASKSKGRMVLYGETLHLLLKDEKLPLLVKVVIVLGIFEGLRASEILGLRWEYVCFDTDTIKIEISWVGKHGDAPKSDSSQTTIPLHPMAKLVLMHWKAYLPSIEGWVFANPITRRPYWRDSVQKSYLKPAGLRIGITDFGWHTLRHSYRYALKKASTINLEMQRDLMRHSDISMTIDYGTAPMLEEMRAANSEATKLLKVPDELSPPVIVKRPKSTSGFFGVYPEAGKYVAKIAVPGTKSKRYIGWFNSAEDAARAYDKEALKLRGSRAVLNFPMEVLK